MSQVVFTTRHKWPTTSNMSHATQHLTRYKFMSQVTCQVKSPCHESTIACYMSQHTSHVTRYKFPCHESQVTCQVTSHLSLFTNHVTCNMSWATIHRSQVKSRVKKSKVNHTRWVTSHVTNWQKEWVDNMNTYPALRKLMNSLQTCWTFYRIRTTTTTAILTNGAGHST